MMNNCEIESTFYYFETYSASENSPKLFNSFLGQGQNQPYSLSKFH